MKERRAGKLNGEDAELFSGEYWTAERARSLGLVDSIGDLRSVLRARYGEKVKTPLIAEKKHFEDIVSILGDALKRAA